MNPNIPCHIAMIMDGNGRWAERHGLPRIRGHQVGVECVENVIAAANEIGVKYLTFYAFSKENWRRPKDEVGFLMELLSRYLDQTFEKFKKNNIVFRTIGDLNDIPAMIREKIRKNVEETKHNTGLVTQFALSYSSRHEIVEACRQIVREAAQGKITPDEISEKTISDHLYTVGVPDPDLLIRTSGEMRISNFLLWQISYTELYVTDKYWPEFNKQEFMKAIEAYQKRERRFGNTRPVSEDVPQSAS